MATFAYLARDKTGQAVNGTVTADTVHIVAPERPNGAHAWIPAERARLFGTDLSLHIDRSAHRLTVSTAPGYAVPLIVPPS